jgi:metal-responsive CopG/Arc/MetJ family transcriptional regulator
MKDTIQYSITQPKEKAEKLDKIAKDQKRSRNNLINIILDEYLEGNFNTHKKWVDKNDKEIKAGMKLYNDWNDPDTLIVLGDDKGNLYLGDYETPFHKKYCLNTCWEIIE